MLLIKAFCMIRVNSTSFHHFKVVFILPYIILGEKAAFGRLHP